MVNQSPLPLHRTNINLYAEDVDYLQSHSGPGWTEIIRELVHNYVADRKYLTALSEEANQPPGPADDR